jgi:hypothetical protein
MACLPGMSNGIHLFYIYTKKKKKKKRKKKGLKLRLIRDEVTAHRLAKSN